MNWEAIGAIGEDVGAIGVIATLAYLAIQIHQYPAGTFDQIISEGYRVNMVQTFSWPTFEGWWRDNQERFGSDFVAFVDEQLRATGRGS